MSTTQIIFSSAGASTAVGWISAVIFPSYGNRGGLALDSSGNVYLGTAFTSTAITAGTHAYAVKYNSSGVVQWAKVAGVSGSNQYGTDVAVDSSGNVYVVGTGDIDAAVPSQDDTLFVKYNSSGTYQAKTSYKFTTTGDDCFRAVTLVGSSLYVAGESFDTGTSVNRAITVKLNSSGVIQWQRKISGSNVITTAIGTSVDGSGNVYSAFSINANFGDALGGGLICKFNSSGTLQWKKRSYLATKSYFGGLTGDSSGNSYLLANNGSTKLYIQKLNTSGSELWAIQITSSSGYSLGPSGYNNIAVDSSGNVYAAFNATQTPQVTVIAKLDSSGTILWTRTISLSTTWAITVTDTHFYLFSQNTSTSFILKLPVDGSGLGTWGGVTYAAATGYSGATASFTVANSLDTDAAGDLTSATDSWTTGTQSATATVTNITV